MTTTDRATAVLDGVLVTLCPLVAWWENHTIGMALFAVLAAIRLHAIRVRGDS